MTDRPAAAGGLPWHRIAMVAVCAATALVASWMLLQPKTATSVADLRELAPLAYVKARPFDPTGWLAWTGSALAQRERPTTRDLEVVAATRLLASNDPQVMRAQAFLDFGSGKVASGLQRTADLATLLPTESKQEYATLLQYLDHPDWLPFVNRQTELKWPGINPLLNQACQSPMPLPALMKLTSQIIARQPISDANVACVGERAVAAGAMPVARWVWLNGSERLPRRIAHVFNGDFEGPIGNQLFDWKIATGGEYREGFSAAIRSDRSKARDNHVLSVRFNRRPVRSVIAQQYLALEPGNYTLQLRQRGSTQPAAKIDWVVSCLPARADGPTMKPVKSPEDNGDDWSRRRAEFAVPESCTGQLLELRLNDKLLTISGLSGEVAFDDISIVRN